MKIPKNQIGFGYNRTESRFALYQGPFYMDYRLQEATNLVAFYSYRCECHEFSKMTIHIEVPFHAKETSLLSGHECRV